jgi:myosin heavy subunit
MGLPIEHQALIFQLLSAILNLGNVAFVGGLHPLNGEHVGGVPH